MSTTGSFVITAPTRPLTDLFGGKVPNSLRLTVGNKEYTIFHDEGIEGYDKNNPLHSVAPGFFEHANEGVRIQANGLDEHVFSQVVLEAEGKTIRGPRCVDSSYFQLANGDVQLHLRAQILGEEAI